MHKWKGNVASAMGGATESSAGAAAGDSISIAASGIETTRA